jgi:hypothetical protein
VGGVGRVDPRWIGVLWWSAALTTTVALALERGPGLGAVEYDRISVAHVALMGGIALAWSAATRMGRVFGSSRLAAAALSAGAAAGILIVVFPGFLQGPFGAVPHELQVRWLDRVVELHPLITLPPVQMAALLVVPVAALMVAVWRLRRGGWEWWLVATWLAIGIGLALVQTRWIMYPQLVAGIPVAAAAGSLIDRVAARSVALRLVTTLAVVIAAVFGWRVIAGLPDGESSPTSEPCSVAAVALLLDQGVVLAAIDHGPEILWRSGASVVASPYHRNVDGILDTLDAFEGDERTAKGIVDRRGIDLIVVCPTVDGKDYPSAGPDSLFTRLVEGDAAAWLRPRAGPDHTAGFLVFEVTG